MKKKIMYAIAGICFCTGLIKYRWQILIGLTYAASCMIYPLLFLFNYTNIMLHAITSIKDRAAYVKEIDALKRECTLLKESNNALQATIAYASDIQEVVAFKKKFGFSDDIIAQIITHHNTPEIQYVLINKGYSAGIEKDMLVVSQNALIGNIIEVYPWYAKVRLITDINSAVPAYIPATNAHGIVKGTGSQIYVAFERVSHLESVSAESMVYTSGYGLIFPKGYAIGTVTSVSKLNLYYQISIKPAVAVTTLMYCVVRKRMD